MAGGEQSFDARMNTLINEFNLLSQDFAAQLARLSNEIVKGIPRALFDLEQVRRDAINMSATIGTVRKEFENTEGDAFKQLGHLDIIKSRMDSTRLLLKEAENWSTLSSEMDALFLSKDWDRSAGRIQDASRSLILLRSSSDYEDRKEMLTKLKDQLEEAILPSLNKAFEDHDEIQAIKFYSIFGKIERTDKLLHHYYFNKTSSLQRIWNEFDSQADLDLRPSDLVKFLQTFCDELYILANQELIWSSHVFPNPNTVISSLLNEIFSSMNPPLLSRLTHLSHILKEESLPFLIATYKVINSFGLRIEKLFFTHNESKSVENGITNLIGNLPISDAGAWGETVFEAFLPFQLDYADYERKYLILSYDIISKVSAAPDHLELVRILGDAVPKSFQLAENAISRCYSFTIGFAAPGLLESLNKFFITSLESYNTLLERIQSESRNNQHQILSSEYTQTNVEDDYDISGENVEGEWSLFQVGLRVLSICQNFMVRLDNFGTIFMTSFRNLNLPMDESSTMTNTKSESTPGFIKDEFCLASQSAMKMSVLNSNRLHDFTSHLDNESSSSLFSKTVQSARALTSKSQRFVYDILFLPIEKQLSSLSNLECWNSTPPVTSSPYNLEMPQFSLSPLDYITRIGEQLLTLPQQLELYAEDDGLGLSLETLPYHEHSHDKSTSSGSYQNPEQKVTSDEIIHVWITAVARGTMLHYINGIQAIPKLSTYGSNQLATDIGYMINILSALSIDPLPYLTRIKGLLELDLSEYQNALESLLSEKELSPDLNQDLFLDKQLAATIGRIRQIP